MTDIDIHLGHLDELHHLLDQLDQLGADQADDYWTVRDAALDLIDRYPELAEAGRSFGLPV